MADSFFLGFEPDPPQLCLDFGLLRVGYQQRMKRSILAYEYHTRTLDVKTWFKSATSA